MRYFSFFTQIFHLSLPKIWQLHPSINYFSKKYMKRQIIPKVLKAVALTLKVSQALELFVIFRRIFSKIWPKTALRKSVAMESWQDLDH